MSRIVEVFQQLKTRNEKALIPYLMAGDPNPERALNYFEALIQGGADLIEIGIPYSDPVADGPTIQSASVRAMNANTTINDVFALVQQMRAKAYQLPLLLMTYYNPILAQGEENFLQRCQETGVDGLIIPDLPAEEAQTLNALAKEKKVNLVFLATPETSEARLAQLAEYSEGFLYLVSRYGVTGAEVGVSHSINGLIQRTRSVIGSDLPLAVGFGLSSPDDIRKVLDAGADAAVVGSALVNEVAKGTLPPLLQDRIRLLKSATRPQSPPVSTPPTSAVPTTNTPTTSPPPVTNIPSASPSSATNTPSTNPPSETNTPTTSPPSTTNMPSTTPPPTTGTPSSSHTPPSTNQP